MRHWALEPRSAIPDPWLAFRMENAVDFGEQITKRLRQELSSRFRIVCLSRNSDNVLMWGHYTQSHRGLVLGFDFSQHDLTVRS